MTGDSVPKQAIKQGQPYHFRSRASGLAELYSMNPDISVRWVDHESTGHGTPGHGVLILRRAARDGGLNTHDTLSKRSLCACRTINHRTNKVNLPCVEYCNTYIFCSDIRVWHANHASLSVRQHDDLSNGGLHRPRSVLRRQHLVVDPACKCTRQKKASAMQKI